MYSLEELKKLAKLQHEHVHDMAYLIKDRARTVQELDTCIEKYVQTRIALALRYGEIAI